MWRVMLQLEDQEFNDRKLDKPLCQRQACVNLEIANCNTVSIGILC
jgi:hypothetical protein